MEELYAEGLATHGDPESCVDDPQGRGEALTGASAGRAIGGVQESSRSGAWHQAIVAYRQMRVPSGAPSDAATLGPGATALAGTACPAPGGLGPGRLLT